MHNDPHEHHDVIRIQEGEQPSIGLELAIPPGERVLIKEWDDTHDCTCRVLSLIEGLDSEDVRPETVAELIMAYPDQKHLRIVNAMMADGRLGAALAYLNQKDVGPSGGDLTFRFYTPPEETGIYVGVKCCCGSFCNATEVLKSQGLRPNLQKLAEQTESYPLTVTSDEIARIQEFFSDHNCSFPEPKNFGINERGGLDIEYLLNLSGLGTVVDIRCLCGEEYQATDFSNW